MCAGVSSAQAQTAGVCVFTGLSGSLTPDIQSIESDLFPVAFDIERGNYNLASGAPLNATCAGLFNGAPKVDQQAQVVSHGSYDNIYCGTVFLHDLNGDGTTVSFPDGNGIGGWADPLGYEIPFVAGQGPMLIGAKGGGRPSLSSRTTFLLTDTANSGPQQDPHVQPVSGNYTGVGFVNIVPERQPIGSDNLAQHGCLTESVNQFTVTGFFIAENAL